VGEWKYGFTFRDHGNRWKRVVSFTSHPLDLQGKNLWIRGWVASTTVLDAM
jgi:hypothetical protein